jgi:hypothetical protein
MSPIAHERTEQHEQLSPEQLRHQMRDAELQQQRAQLKQQQQQLLEQQQRLNQKEQQLNWHQQLSPQQQQQQLQQQLQQGQDSNRAHMRVLFPADPNHDSSAAMRTADISSVQPPMSPGPAIARNKQLLAQAKQQQQTVVTPSGRGEAPRRTITLAQEFEDTLQGNEFCICFRQYSQTHEARLLRPNVRNLVFTLNFFNKPAFRSKLVPLITKVQSQELKGVNSGGGSDKLSARGEHHSHPFVEEYRVVVPAEEQRVFAEYLYSKQLHIDVWDADSMFQLGTVRLALRPWLRQGAQWVEKLVSLDVEEVPVLGGALTGASVFGSNSSNSSGKGSSRRCVSGGKLVMAISNTGLAPARKAHVDHMLNTTIPTVNSSLCLLKSDFEGPASFRGAKSTLKRALDISVNAHVNSTSKIRARYLAEQEPRLAETLIGPQALSGLSYAQTSLDKLNLKNGFSSFASTKYQNEESKEQQQQQQKKPQGSTRRARRKQVAPIHKTMLVMSGAGNGLDEQEDSAIRLSNLAKIKSFRDSHRRERIAEKLRSSLEQRRSITPSYGQLVFFEVAFRNPYARAARFAVSVQDPQQEPDTQQQQQQQTATTTQPTEMSIVTDLKEWQFLKNQYGFKTRTNTRMFVDDDGSDKKQQQFVRDTGNEDAVRAQTPAARRSTRYILLQGHETVHIPVKFQSWKCGDIDAAYDATTTAFPPAAVRPSYERMQKRCITVAIANHDAVCVSRLRVLVQPKPFVIDRTFRFNHWGDDIVHQRIPLLASKLASNGTDDDGGDDTNSNSAAGGNASSMFAAYSPHAVRVQPSSSSSESKHGGGGQQELFGTNNNSGGGGNAEREAALAQQINMHISAEHFVKRVVCSNRDVAVSLQKDKHAASATPVLIFKTQLNKFPSVHRFFVCLFTDAYFGTLRAVYQVYVHAHLRCNTITCTVGQPAPGKLYLPATQLRRRVQVFSTAPDELSFAVNSAQSFTLEPGHAKELGFTYTTRHGTRQYALVHLVDVENHVLVASWMLYVHAVFPRTHPQNEFEVVLRCGQGARKNFDFENVYAMPRTYVFASSCPELLSMTQSAVAIPAKSVAAVHLAITPRFTPGTESVYVFCNDEKGNTEEALKFNLVYIR